MSARFRFVDKPAAPEFFYRAWQGTPPDDRNRPRGLREAARDVEDVSPGVLAFTYGVIVGSLLGVLLTLAARGVADWWLG